jgi:hypothetical protein
MRRKLGWEGEREREGGEENLRLDGVFPALPFASADDQTTVAHRHRRTQIRADKTTGPASHLCESREL